MEYPCPEWVTCANKDDVQCWNGLCVSDETVCPLKENGCPIYKPLKCPYSEVKCVEALTECTFTDPIEAKTKKSAWCNSKSGGTTPIACATGNCAASEEACPAEFPAVCQEYMYPNTLKATVKKDLTNIDESQCLIPHCPLQAPHKCANGLCVTAIKYCPSV
jgi:hypothetical protein